MQKVNALKRIRFSGEAAAWLAFWMLAVALPTPINLLNPWKFIFILALGLPVATVYSVAKLRYIAGRRAESGVLVRQASKEHATEIVSILALVGAWLFLSRDHPLLDLYLLALLLAAARIGFFGAFTTRQTPHK